MFSQNPIQFTSLSVNNIHEHKHKHNTNIYRATKTNMHGTKLEGTINMAHMSTNKVGLMFSLCFKVAYHGLTKIIRSNARMQLSGDVEYFVSICCVKTTREGEILILGPDEVGFVGVDRVFRRRLPTLQFVVQHQRMLPYMIST